MRQLLQRRVPQIAGAYLAASWVLLEFTDWAVNQWSLSPALTNFVVITLLLLLPMVVALAWRHGAPGQDAWTTTDGAVIGLNLAAAAGILVFAFSGQELGAATTVRLLEDDAGNTVERVIPKAGFRRDVLVWDFDNESGDPALDWLRSGLWMGLMQDLYQDLFVTPIQIEGSRAREGLDEAGFELPYGVPLALKRRLAEAGGAAHFLEGELLESDGDTLVVRTRLYETRNAREIAARTYRGTDPLEMVDRISVDLRRDLGIPDWQIEDSVDLPAAEILTDSPEAFRAVSGYRPALYQNRLADARAAAEAAIDFDSAFASAHGMSASASLLMGDQAAAQARIADALRYAYRLPERSRLAIQMLDRMLFRMDPAGALQTGSYWAELYPHDRQARELLAGAYATQGDFDAAIAQYRALLAMDSTHVRSLQEIAGIFSEKGVYDSALVYYSRLAELQSGDTETRLDIASTLSSLRRFDEAREELERAQIAAPTDPGVLDRLARLDMQLGRYEDAGSRFEEMSALVRTPQERELAAAVKERYAYSLGHYRALQEAFGRRVEAAREHQPPIGFVLSIMYSEALAFAGDWGRDAAALAQIDRLQSTVEEPWRLVLEVPAVQIHLDRGDIQAARASQADLRRLDEAFGGGAPERTARILWIDGRIAELEDGDCGRALESYEEAARLRPREPLYRAWLARCLTSLQRWNEAQSEMAWLLERFPGSAKIRQLAARNYAARGMTAEAIAELEIALGYWSTADADYRPAQEARALLDELQTAR
jgi:tetratricopeptide (TPR) repeat protein